MATEKSAVDASPAVADATASPSTSTAPPSTPEQHATPTEQPFWRRLATLARRLHVEERGIRRVETHERHAATSNATGPLHAALLWFSINLAANNVTLGMLGPSVFNLPFNDASACAVGGMFLGCLPVCYIATFGPASGCRALVVARYSMGWWPAKIIVLLNIAVFLGYSLIDAVVAGQILSAVSPDGRLSVAVGIVIVSLVALVLTTFGYRLVHLYERYAWLPQLVVFSILAGVAGPHFDTSSPPPASDSATRAGTRLSFFSLCLAAAITYAGGAADYFVYYPARTSRTAIFLATLAGLSASFTFAFMLGIGLASGASQTPAWADASSTSQGALIVAGYAPLGSFGSVCAVIVALGLVANMAPPTYSAGVDWQVLGRWAARVPRAAWNAAGVVAYGACALAGRDHLAAIFTNFLALMGYWVVVWIAIAVEEDVLFRRGWAGVAWDWVRRMLCRGSRHGEHQDRSHSAGERSARDSSLSALGWDWTAWNVPSRLPVGLAALAAFLVGWAGAIVSMDQVWYVGPVAALVGDEGADMGNYVGFAWAALVYPPLRYVELRRFGR